MRRVEDLRELERARVCLVGTVVGLVSEADRLEDLFEEVAPDRVALGISPGELGGLEMIVQGEIDEEVEIPTSDIDEAYAHHLTRYGPVRLPPPGYLRLLEACLEDDVPVEPLDLDEEAFTDAYTDNVGAIDLIRKGRRERKMAKRGIEATSAREFARKWDESLLKVGGLRDLESLREDHMADRLEAVCSEPGSVLAVVESVRVGGVRSRLWPKDPETADSSLLPW